MPSTGMVDVTMISSNGAGIGTAMTPTSTGVFFHGYDIQHASEVDTVIFRDGSTGSMWVHSPKASVLQQSGSDTFSFGENSPWFKNGIYLSHASTRIVSIYFSNSQGLS